MEDFGYKKDEGENNFSNSAKRFFLIGATLFSIACFIYVAISAYYFVYEDKESNIEVIKSPEGPIKVLEEETSEKKDSMQIDRSIYEDIFGNKNHAKKEVAEVHLRQIPQPALPPKSLEIDRRLVKESDAKLAQETPKEKNLKNPNQLGTKAAQKIIVFSDDQKKEASSQDLLTKGSEEKNDSAAKTTVKPNEKQQKRAIRVQVAALTSKESANDAWKNLNRANSSLFSGLKPFIQEIDLGKRGIFYRLQVGNFFNQVEAEEFCNRYVAQTQKSRADCIVAE